MSRREQVKRVIEKRLGDWFDENAELLLRLFPDAKFFPLLCGSLVEGFATAESDVDFALLIDDERRYRVGDELRANFQALVERLDNDVKKLEFSHMCSFSRTIRTKRWLLAFERSRNPSFRVNYFLFSQLLHPRPRKSEVERLIATDDDLRRLKRELLERFREKYGYAILKLGEDGETCLEDPGKYASKRVYRCIQIVINSFIAAYGLEIKRLKMDDELKGKLEVITRTVLSKEAHEKLLKGSNYRSILNKLIEFRSRKYKYKRLKTLFQNGELEKLYIFTNFLLKFVYRPLQSMYEPHAKIIHALSQLGWNISYVGVRTTHAFIAVKEPPIRCIDVIPIDDNQYGVCAAVKKGYERIFEGYEELIEEKIEEEVWGSFTLPVRTHRPLTEARRRKGRRHFKLFSIKKETSFEDIAAKLSEVKRICKENARETRS